MQTKCLPFFMNSTYIFSKECHNNLESVLKAAGRNTGNSYITYAIIKEIFGYVKECPHIQTLGGYNFKNQDKDIHYINEECSHLVLVAQDWIRPKEFEIISSDNINNLINFIKKINKPIVVAGIGINDFTEYDNFFVKRLSPEMIHFLHILKEHCKCIGVRGKFTFEVLHQLGINNTQIIGCPTFYENGSDRSIIKKDLSDIVFTSPITFRMENNPYVCLQSEQSILEKIWSGDLFLNYYKNYFFSTSIDKWKYFVSKFSFAYGTRVHGAIIAINAGVPAVVLNNDLRAREMCEFMKIPYFPADITKSIENVFNECNIDIMNNTYMSLYENFKKFMAKNDIYIVNPDHMIKNNCYDFEIYNNPLKKREREIVGCMINIKNEINELKKNAEINKSNNEEFINNNILSNNAYKIYRDINRIKNNEYISLNNKQYIILKKIIDAKFICIYGLGALFRDNYFGSAWNNVFSAKFFCDGDSNKWGKPLNNFCQSEQTIGDDVLVISPQKLPRDDKLLVITYVKNDTDIVNDLNKLYIYNIINIYDIYNIYNT